MSFCDYHANATNHQAGEVGHESHEGELEELNLSLNLIMSSTNVMIIYLNLLLCLAFHFIV